MSFGLLYMDAVSLEDGLTFPHCPTCGAAFAHSDAFTVMARGLRKNNPDFNAKVIIACLHCDTPLELFVALHRYDDGSIALCLQKTVEEGADGIRSDWWVKPTW